MSDPDLSRPFKRNPDIVERRVGESLFLAEAEGEAIFRLNPTGAALWRLLVRPITLEDAVVIFSEAFPDRTRADIDAELAALMAELVTRGLIVEAG